MDANRIIEEYLINAGYEDLKGYEGLYKINKKGELWSCHYKASIFPQEQEGYLCTNLTNKFKKSKVYIHRLLAIQYIENQNNYPEVDHIDRNRSNNSLENLRWVDKTIQNNNKCNCVALKTEEEQEQRIEDIKEYKRQWAENNRRENGVNPKGSKNSKSNSYKAEKQREYRASMTEEEKQQHLEHRRELYAEKEQTDEQKEAAKERSKKQREEIKADPEKLAQQREYKRLKAQEYRAKKKAEQTV